LTKKIGERWAEGGGLRAKGGGRRAKSGGSPPRRGWGWVFATAELSCRLCRPKFKGLAGGKAL